MEIEDIQQLRWKQGIEDLELHAAISSLQVGDSVKLTFRTDRESFAGETLLVRITSIRGPAFRGRLASRPTSTGLSRLGVGSLIAFVAAHIHSLPRGHEIDEQ